MKCFVLISICILLLPALTFSQSDKPTVSKVPAWVTQNKIDYKKKSLDKEALDGFINVSYERQISLKLQSEYVRLSKKIISQSGVQNGSEISISFDPIYEKLSFHSLGIIRNGEFISKLDLSKIKVVHQESELTNFIYNGLYNAIFILDDIRKGDIIEYSYTLQGFNPIFKNKYSAQYGLEYGIPVYELYYKLIVPNERKINIKVLNGNIKPTITQSNGEQIYEWSCKDVPPLTTQDYCPSWYDAYSQILVSEYSSWKEVNDWALEMFPKNNKNSKELDEKIEEIKKEFSSDEDRTKAVLRFVQDEIRYMGMEMGTSSHKPSNASKVFTQRYGDCKEKSFLMCTMLNSMNITASPVLINTVSKKEINTFLPTPSDFDHVTVRVQLGKNYYWFDPTISYQRGDIKKIYYPDYQTGLVISENTNALTAIPFRNIGFQSIKEFFKIQSIRDEAILIVTTTYEGNMADDIRNDFNNSSIKELMTKYQKFYAFYYDNIKSDSLTYEDNEATGVFTTNEYYKIPGIWKTEKGKAKKISFYSYIIDNALQRPKERDRKMPFSLLFPIRYKEEVIIKMPEDWPVTESQLKLNNKSFTYSSRFYSEYNTVYLVSDYTNYKDHVKCEEADEYFTDLETYDAQAAVVLTSGGEEVDEEGTSKNNKDIIGVVIIFIIMGGMYWWMRRAR